MEWKYKGVRVKRTEESRLWSHFSGLRPSCSLWICAWVQWWPSPIRSSFPRDRLLSDRVAGKFYVKGEQRAERVQDLFAEVAPRYDLINDLQSLGLHRLWKRRLLRLSAIRPGEHALDLCCGTGDIALALRARGAEVVGVDFSAPMLDVARQRASRDPVSKAVTFEQGDALRLRFPDESFDVVTISYGLRNLADIPRGLSEMHRVLRPGGRLLILDFGKPEWPPLRWLYFQYLARLVPVFGRLFFGDADTHGYILDSLRDYPAQRGVDALLRRLGFESTQTFNLLGGIMGLHEARKPPPS